MSKSLTRPTVEEVWRILDGVADPEIPVISIVDLGIIREVSWQGDTLHVAITPTYSGCPATAVINLEIDRALRAQGIEQIELRRRLSPPWTTDWLSARGRDKLRAYGIAPPMGRDGDKPGAGGKAVPPCPRCSSSRTHLVSQFGSTPCKAAYVCNECLEPFDYFKCF